MIRRLVQAMLVLWLAMTGTCWAQAQGHHVLSAEERMPVRPRYLLAGPDGGAVSDEDFRGRFQLLGFGYTSCPDVCPTTLLEMKEALRLLDDIPLQAIFVTLDPERDTPAVLNAYLGHFDPRILGLGGTPELIARAASNFRVRYAKVRTGNHPQQYSVDHSTSLYLLGTDGSYIARFAYGTPADRLAAQIRAYAGAE